MAGTPVAGSVMWWPRAAVPEVATAPVRNAAVRSRRPRSRGSSTATLQAGVSVRAQWTAMSPPALIRASWAPRSCRRPTRPVNACSTDQPLTSPVGLNRVVLSPSGSQAQKAPPVRWPASSHSEATWRIRGCASRSESRPSRIRLTGLSGRQMLNIASSARSSAYACSTASATASPRACGPRTWTLIGSPMIWATKARRGSPVGEGPSGRHSRSSGDSPGSVNGCTVLVTGVRCRWRTARTGGSRRW